jgi:hypothetical protein
MVTYLFTVDNVGQGEQIIVQSICSRIRLKQNDQSVSILQPFVVRIPGASSPAVRHEGGETIEFLGRFTPNSVLGYVELVNSAAVQFAQIEDFPAAMPL